MKLQILTLSLLVGLAFPASAAKPIDETRPLDARGTVNVKNISGRIEVRVWDKPQVHIGGSLGNGVERFEVEGDSRQLDVRVKYPRNSNITENTTLILQVPTLASLSIEGVSADIDVTGTAGAKLDIDSVSGDITVVGAPGRADIQSVSGDVVATLNSTNVCVQSVSGDLSLRGRLDGSIKGEVVSGELNIDTRDKRVRDLTANSISGNIIVRGNLADGGRINAETTSGDIKIVMPKSLSARVNGKSFSGDLSAPGARISRPQYGPGSDFDQRYGDGSGEIRIQTFSGNGKLELY